MSIDAVEMLLALYIAELSTKKHTSSGKGACGSVTGRVNDRS